jgi:lipoprotein-releasing system permease protein
VRFELFLTFRYLRFSRLLAQATAAVAFCGIACGVAALILTLALANGFRRAMQEKILNNTAHITVFRADDGEIADWRLLKEKINQSEGVARVSATSVDNALIIGKNSANYAVLRGVENAQDANDKFDTETKIKIEVGKILAEKAGLKIGDAAEIIAGGGKIGADSFAPISTLVEIGAIFETGLYDYDSTWIRASLPDGARLTGRDFPAPTVLTIETADIYQSQKISQKIAEKLGGDFKVLDWREANRPLFAALALERRAAIAVIFLIVLLAVSNVTTTLALVVRERAADIAVLKTCGARTRSIVLIFLVQGVVLGVAGVAAGVTLGWLACFIANRFDLISLPSGVYAIERVSLEPNLTDIVSIFLAILVLCLAASALPSWWASRIRSHEILRNNP